MVAKPESLVVDSVLRGSQEADPAGPVSRPEEAAEEAAEELAVSDLPPRPRVAGGEPEAALLDAYSRARVGCGRTGWFLVVLYRGGLRDPRSFV